MISLRHLTRALAFMGVLAIATIAGPMSPVVAQGGIAAFVGAAEESADATVQALPTEPVVLKPQNPLPLAVAAPPTTTTTAPPAPPTTEPPLPAPATPEQEMAQVIDTDPAIALAPVQPSGVNDNADARTNIDDTARGIVPLRSDYQCIEGRAPGGRVHIDSRVLATILEIKKKYKIGISAITGACHSDSSLHYQGRAVDFASVNDVPIGSLPRVATDSIYEDITNICRAKGAAEALRPGDAGHATHIHCGWR